MAAAAAAAGPGILAELVAKTALTEFVVRGEAMVENHVPVVPPDLLLMVLSSFKPALTVALDMMDAITAMMVVPDRFKA